MFAPVLIATCLLSLISAAPTTNRDGLQLISNCLNQGQVALTYDDGPFKNDAGIGHALNTTGANGTFFLNGNNFGCIYDNAQLIRNLSAQGHTFGAHTWSHKNLITLDDGQIHQDLNKLETAFIKILGRKPLYFRPPYGSYDDRVLNVLAQRGYKKVFLWTDDTQDALGSSLDSQKDSFDNVSSHYPTPRLVLQHSVVDSSVNATMYGIIRLMLAGYKIVSVDECMGETGNAYEYVGEPEEPNDSWRC